MSGYKGHLLAGFIVGILFFLIALLFFGWFDFSFITIITSIIIISIYSLLSDCDISSSKISWTFVGISATILLLGIFLDNNFYLYFGIALLVFTFICAQFFGHRKFIHSWSAGIIFCLPLYLLGLEFSLLGFAVFWSHLCLDGIPFKLV